MSNGLLGGALIGLAATIYLLATGRVAGGPREAIGENDGRVFVMLRLLIALPHTRLEQHLRRKRPQDRAGPGHLIPGY